VAFAQAMAAVLSERGDELGISRDTEALLRASIGAATYAMDMYVAVVAVRKEIAGGTAVCGGGQQTA